MLNTLLIGIIVVIALKLAFKLLFKGIKVVFILAVLYIVATQALGFQANLLTNILSNLLSLI